VKVVVEQMKKQWPEGLQVSYTQDKSKVIRQMLADLQNSVITGVILVTIIILFALGFRASLFIGIAIPASFLTGNSRPADGGPDVNIVVLFSLILAVRHAGRRRDHRVGIRRAANVGRHAAARGRIRSPPNAWRDR